MTDELQEALNRIIAGERILEDIGTIASAIQSGRIVLANVSGSVGVGRDVSGSQVIPGNNNVISNQSNVVHIYGEDAKAIQSIPFVQTVLAQDQISMCNLPQEGYLEFIGRKEELRKILDYLAPDNRRYIISICGVGGVGKTALALNAAHLCWEAKKKEATNGIPKFDAIVFTSAKITTLSPNGVLTRPLREGTLTEILLTIARVLDEQAITQATPEEQRRWVYDSLRKQSTLLIVDNLETMKEQDQDEVLAFLEDLPPGCKAIITSRKQTLQRTHVSLDELPEEDCISLIHQHAEEKGLVWKSAQARRLYHRFGGVPAALIYAVGQRAAGYSFKKILSPRSPLPKDIAHFCFDSSVEALTSEACHLLLALGIFKGAPTWDAWSKVAGVKSENLAQQGISQLKLLSLIKEVEDQQHITRYRMLDLTREYVLHKLASEYMDFEELARLRWVDWYLKFSSKYGGMDRKGWHVRYDYLQGELNNLRGVLKWCVSRQRYEQVRDIWWQIDNFIDLYGYWQERLDWLTWLIDMSLPYADMVTHVMAKSEKGWSLLLMQGVSAHQEAEKVLAEAWNFRNQVEPSVQADIANHMAVLKTLEKNYSAAIEWLTLEENIVQAAKLKGEKQVRHELQVAYYKAEVYYFLDELDQAQALFQMVFKRGKEVGWQRFANYAQNHLADIAIVRGDLEFAEQLLQSGLDEARSNSEKRRIAHYQATYARLARQQGNMVQAQEWANKALEGFKVEGMAWDAEDMRSLLEQVEMP
jgi:tetratricopeptide (TPR) repeat protein